MWLLTNYNVLLGTALAFLAYSIYYSLKLGSRLPNMPHGPPTIPILGNLTIFPRSRFHLKFTEWANVYGDVFSLRILNQTIIVINTPTFFHELIDKRSTSTSNRPKSILADMITPNNMNMGTGHLANGTWKSMRKASAQLLNLENMRRLSHYQRAEATQLMWELVHKPEDWFVHLRRHTTSFALGIIYGKRGPRASSPDVADFLEVHPQFIQALEIGTMPPVDLFPVLTLVPESLAKWKRIVKSIRNMHERLYDRLLTTVESRMNSGKGIGAFMEQIISKAGLYGLTTREHLMHLGGTLLEGSDTCSAVLQTAIYCLINYPRVMERAREEIDLVVGKERAPDWDDIPKLPYLLAFIEECHRFRPVGPLGLPHAMVQDEIVDGLLFPKDSIIFYNLWGMFHDERYFDRPEEFIPERFLKHPLGIKEGIEDVPGRRQNMVFGGGRRVCPGIVFAKTSLEINVANLIWGFDILPAVNPVTGQKLVPDLNAYSNGVTATPKEFPVSITPRSSLHKEIIDRQFASAVEVLSIFESEISEEDMKFNSAFREGLV